MKRLTYPYLNVNKFGRNPEVDAADTADIWDYGGVNNGPSYPWPTAAAATTIVSDSIADDSAGTGARTVNVQGLNADYELTSEDVTLDGTTAVTLTNEYLRIFRAKVLTVGSGGINAGNIDIKHTTTILARITADYGQTLMAIYTVPANTSMYLYGWKVNARMPNAGGLSCRLDVREFGKSWNTKETAEMGGQIGAFYRQQWEYGNKLPPKTDIRVRVYNGTDNNTVVSGGFDLATTKFLYA